MRRTITAVGVALFALGAAGCGEHPLYGSERLRMELSPASSTLSAIGSTQQLTLTATDASGRAANPRLLLWETTDPEVATVDQAGRVTAHREGIVGISVRAGTAGFASTRVYVDPRVRSSVWIARVANRDLRPENDRDTASVLLHHHAGTRP